MDFHNRLVAKVQKLDGVSGVCLLPRGKSAGRFRRHPHLVITLVNGKTFEHTVKQRPRDTWRRFLNYLCAIRRRVREFSGSSRQAAPVLVPPKRVARKPSRKRCQPNLKATLAPTVPTRLDLDPWAPLRGLITN